VAILVPNAGEVIALNYLTNKQAPENLVYRLFTNAVTPAETDTSGTYTEASGGGYAAITLAGAAWTVTGGAPSSASTAQQTWTFTGALTGNATVRGYYVTRLTTGDLVLAEAQTNFQPTTNGDLIRLTPQITAD
jgi:hypothetical protein